MQMHSPAPPGWGAPGWGCSVLLRLQCQAQASQSSFHNRHLLSDQCWGERHFKGCFCEKSKWLPKLYSRGHGCSKGRHGTRAGVWGQSYTAGSAGGSSGNWGARAALDCGMRMCPEEGCEAQGVERKEGARGCCALHGHKRSTAWPLSGWVAPV